MSIDKTRLPVTTDRGSKSPIIDHEGREMLALVLFFLGVVTPVMCAMFQETNDLLAIIGALVAMALLGTGWVIHPKQPHRN